MNKKRLLNVAKALRESKAPDDFRMEVYSNYCGTPACALGHYASRRDLQTAFTFESKYGGYGRLYDDHGFSVDFIDEDIGQHFDIDYRSCEELFSASGCSNAKTTTDAATYIETWVANPRNQAINFDPDVWEQQLQSDD